MILAADLLRELFDYSPETGVFTWKCNPAGIRRGSRAGSVDVDRNGYKRRRIKINGKSYRSSDLAWLYVTGEWPTASVDHKNRDGTDDSWDNLRLATRSQQMINRRNWGRFPRGVSMYDGGYMARITVAGKTKYLGAFLTVEAAEAAYNNAAKEYGHDFGR